MADSALNGLIQAGCGCMAHGSLNQLVLGFGHQYMTQIKVLMKKTQFLAKIAFQKRFSHSKLTNWSFYKVLWRQL